MKQYVAFLRGIDLGKRRVPIARLAQAHPLGREDLGRCFMDGLKLATGTTLDAVAAIRSCA